MPNFREYNAKLQSTGGMRRVTSTMKTVSSSHLRKAQRDLRAPAPFAVRLGALIRQFCTLPSVRKNKFLAPADTSSPRILLFVVSADRGLCGSFSNNVVHEVRRFAEEQRRERNASVQAVYIGQKAYHALKADFPSSFHLVSADTHPTLRHTQVLSAYAMRLFLENRADEVWICANRFVSTMKRETETRRILPLDPDTVDLCTIADAPDLPATPAHDVLGLVSSSTASRLSGKRHVSAPPAGRQTGTASDIPTPLRRASPATYTRPLPVSAESEEVILRMKEETARCIVDPSPDRLVSAIARQWLALAFFHAEAHSCASEHAARMISMDSATKNLDQMTKTLLVLRNRARQASITNELTEIVAGAEALKG